MSDLTRDLYAYLLNHMYSVSHELRLNGYWTMSPAWLQEIRMMTDPDGRALWEARPSMDEPDMLFGRPVRVSDAAGIPRLTDKPVIEDWVPLRRYA